MSPTKKISYIYNPDRQSPEELINNFVIRLREFKDIFDDIKGTPPAGSVQHYIIQGPRGTGKTTLLLRLFYEIQNDRKLNKKIIPVIFSEEQYHIGNLCRLWESAAEHLEEREDFSGLYDEFEKAMDAKDYEDSCFGILAGALAKRKRKLVLLIDNIGDLLRRFSEEEHHRLREILLTSSEVRIIGASSVTLEYTFDYSEPFFEFFKIVHIGGLGKEDTNALLLSLSKNYNEEGIQKIIEEQPERIEILRRLTGGIPRTIILLFEIFADDKSGDSFKDLEIILDRVTPLYKHRMEDLSRQQQQIVDAMAMSWDAVSTKELAEKVRLDSKLVSAQLKQLEKNRIVHKIETDTKNYLYQITERFFNIWYLMRHGRRKDRNRVLWLVKFLNEWCGREELVERAKRHLESLEKKGYYPGHAYIMTEALSRTDISWELQDELIGKTREFLNKKDKTLARDLSKSDIELNEEVKSAFKGKDLKKCLGLLYKIKIKSARYYYNVGLIHHELEDFRQAEKNYLAAIAGGHVSAMNNLAGLYKDKLQFEKAEKYYLMAIENEHVRALNSLAQLYFMRHKNKRMAHEYMLRYYEQVNDYDTELGLVFTMLWNNRIDEAMQHFRIVLSLAKEDDNSYMAIQGLLSFMISKKQYHAALQAFEEKSMNFKERFKPLYYALMYFIQDEYPNEYRKMGEELKETVEEIIKQIEQMSVDYA